MSGAGGKRRATLTADTSAAGERLDLFIARGLAGVSRKAVKKALDGGQVFVDGRTERRAGHLLRGSETVTVTLDLPEPVPPAPELPILYRDGHLLAVDKPAGLPAHPTVAGRANALSLITDLLRGEGDGIPILLHRLDADTTGVLLFALTAEANRELSRQFAGREVEKAYLALVAGTPPASFRVVNHLKAGVRGRTVAVASGGQPAETHFRKRGQATFEKSCLSPSVPIALIEARPKTGRTHQIRAHLAGAGFPILGDSLYGGPGEILIDGEKHLIRRHLLHAFRLTFRHPNSGETVAIEAPIPVDFEVFKAVLSCKSLN